MYYSQSQQRGSDASRQLTAGIDDTLIRDLTPIEKNALWDIALRDNPNRDVTPRYFIDTYGPDRFYAWISAIQGRAGQQRRSEIHEGGGYDTMVGRPEYRQYEKQRDVTVVRQKDDYTEYVIDKNRPLAKVKLAQAEDIIPPANLLSFLRFRGYRGGDINEIDETHRQDASRMSDLAAVSKSTHELGWKPKFPDELEGRNISDQTAARLHNAYYFQTLADRVSHLNGVTQSQRTISRK